MKEHMRRMETVEMRFVRAVGGYRMADDKPNKDGTEKDIKITISIKINS
jgi:hypothetical protein